MTTPIGLTRAEEALEQKPPEVRVVVKAPPGALTCRVVVPPDGKECGAAATHRIVWPSRDGWDKPTSACKDCVVRMQQLAESHRTVIHIEPIRRSTPPVKVSP